MSHPSGPAGPGPQGPSGPGPGRTTPREQMDQAERLVREAKDLLYHAWDGQPVFPVGHTQTLLGSAVSRLEAALLDLGKLGRPAIGFALPSVDLPSAPSAPPPADGGRTPDPAVDTVGPAVSVACSTGPARQPAGGAGAEAAAFDGRAMYADLGGHGVRHDPDPVPPRPRPAPGADEGGAW